MKHDGYPNTTHHGDHTTEWSAPGVGVQKDLEGNIIAVICCPYIPMIPGFTAPVGYTGPDFIDTTKQTIAEFDYDRARGVVE